MKEQYLKYIRRVLCGLGPGLGPGFGAGFGVGFGVGFCDFGGGAAAWAFDGDFFEEAGIPPPVHIGSK